MTSLFDSSVYDARRAVEWAEIDLTYLMKDLAQSAEGNVTLEVINRPAVSSRFWWRFTWTGADGEQHTQEAQTLGLCLWRVAIHEKKLRAKVYK